MKAMLLAAGLGTRLRPWTEKHPKALFPVGGRSLLERNILYLQAAGIFDVVVNVHHFADQIEAAIRESGGWGSRVAVSDERDEVLETGGGLMRAQALLDAAGSDIDEPFVLMNVDVLTDLDLGAMIRAHRERASLATLAVMRRKTGRALLFDGAGRLCGWRNQVTGEERIARQTALQLPFAFSGVHIIDPVVFNLCPLTGKFSMIDLYLNLAAEHEILGYDHTGDRFVDVGKPGSADEAERVFG